MILFAAIMPPLPALEAVVEVMSTAVSRVTEPAPQAPARRRSRWRRGGNDEPPEPVDEAVPLEIRLGHVHLLVARFGSTTPADAERITKAVGGAAAGWSPPRVRFAGGTLLDRSGAREVGVSLEGDLDDLATIAREVNRVAQGLGFLLDRRSFRPVLPVAVVPRAASDAYVQNVLAALDDYQGDSWTVDHLSLLRGSLDATAAPRELVRLPLAREVT